MLYLTKIYLQMNEPTVYYAYNGMIITQLMLLRCNKNSTNAHTKLEFTSKILVLCAYNIIMLYGTF